MFRKIYEAISFILKKLGIIRSNFNDVSANFPNYSGYYETNIAKWNRIYKGDPDWKAVDYSKLGKPEKREMQMLNTAKSVCAEFAATTFSEQVEITIDSEDVNRIKDELLKQNSFWTKFPEWLEKAFALGGGSLKCYLINGTPTIDYVDADCFVPSAWDNRRITGGAFISHSRSGEYFYNLVEMHIMKGNNVEVNNILYRSKSHDELGVQVNLSEMYPGLSPTVNYKSVNHPMFSYFKPALANNLDPNIPLGISVFANAIDTLKALDVAFDSFTREFVLGKKRVIVPAQAMRSVTDIDTGEQLRYFDANDEAYVAFNIRDNETFKIVDNTVELRIEEHVSAINALLNILCMQTNLSSGTFSFDGSEGSVKTATEIVSENSKTQRTRKAQQNALVELIEDTVDNLIKLYYLSQNKTIPQYKITVGFKDNILIDDNTLIDNNIKLVQAGLKSKIKAIMEIQKCDEATAQEELERIAKEQSVTGLSVDDFMNGGEDDDQTGDDEAQSGTE